MEDKNRVLVSLYLNNQEEMDLDVPLNITVEELLKGLNEALGWKMSTKEMESVYLRAENPIAFLKGSHSLEQYHLRDGSRLFLPLPEKQKKQKNT